MAKDWVVKRLMGQPTTMAPDRSKTESWETVFSAETPDECRQYITDNHSDDRRGFSEVILRNVAGEDKP